MATLIYSPGIKIYINTMNNGIVDVSDDIESGSLTLNENAPHSLSFSLSNAAGKYSSIFTPNDRIVVQMKRLQWLQIFSGYLDSVPYFSAFPQSVSVTATCSLKQVFHHYWDPQYAPNITWLSTQINSGSASDVGGASAGGVINALQSVMTQIIGWDPSRIHIGSIPPTWFSNIAPIWDQLSADVSNLITMASPFFVAAGINSTSAVNTGPTGTPGQIQGNTLYGWCQTVLANLGPTFVTTTNLSNVAAWVWSECPHNDWWANGLNPLNINASGAGYDHFTSLSQNAQAVSDLISTSDYTSIKAALARSASWSDFKSAVINTPWASGHYSTNTIGPPWNGAAFASVGVPDYAGPPGNENVTSSSAPVSSSSTFTSTVAAHTINGQTALNASVGSPAGIAAAQLAMGVAARPGAKGLYVWGGTGPNTFDCSGLVMWCWNQQPGYNIPHNTISQYESPFIQIIDISKIQAGDLLFVYYTGSGEGNPPSHVAMYVGNGQVVEAADSDIGVIQSPLESWGGFTPGGGGYFMGVGRVLPTSTPASGQQSTTKNQYSPVLVNPTTLQQITGPGAGQGPTYGAGGWDPTNADEDPMAGAFSGVKLLLQDSPIMPLVQELCKAGLRSFCSAPNGDFIAWFPDYFDQYGYATKWHLSPVEMDAFTISWSDSNLVTHEYTAGAFSTLNTSLDPTQGGAMDGDLNAIYSSGVATIDLPGLIEAVTNVSNTDGGVFSDVNTIYLQFGPRPNYETMSTMAAIGEVEFWYAVKRFMENWAAQFTASVQLTFMPELYPGMLLCIDALGVQMYVTSVSHNFNLGSHGGGFTTTAQVKAPSAMDGSGLIGLAKSGSQS